jgi:hypothetical protein
VVDAIELPLDAGTYLFAVVYDVIARQAPPLQDPAH